MRRLRTHLPPTRDGDLTVDGEQDQFEIWAVTTFGPDLQIRCTRCRRWSAHIDRPITLADLNRRASEHTEVCR
jgi:hypothetical protein